MPQTAATEGGAPSFAATPISPQLLHPHLRTAPTAAPCPRWVSDEVARQYGICSPDTEGAAKPKAAANPSASQSGWSAARAQSSKRLTSNPNAFFYRHVAPHEQQVRRQLPGSRLLYVYAHCFDAQQRSSSPEHRTGHQHASDHARCPVSCSAWLQHVCMPEAVADSCWWRPSCSRGLCARVRQAMGEWTREEHELSMRTSMNSAKRSAVFGSTTRCHEAAGVWMHMCGRPRGSGCTRSTSCSCAPRGSMGWATAGACSRRTSWH